MCGLGRPKVKEKKNGLVGAKKGGRAAHLRNREKTIGLVGAKNWCGLGQPKEKERTNGLVRAKNRGRGGPT